MSYRSPAPMEFPTPTEFHNHEVTHGPPVRVTNTFKVSIPMDNHLRDYARQNQSDLSACIRHALYEYLKSRGFSPLSPV